MTWTSKFGWQATNEERKDAYKKLRKAGVPSIIARSLREWRPSSINKIAAGKAKPVHLVKYRFDKTKKMWVLRKRKHKTL
jgi:hypothetical protein